MMKTAQQKQPENDSFMIHCGPKILILYHVISCNANYLEVKKVSIRATPDPFAV